MVGRAAMWNCSVFSKKGRADLDIVIKRFLEIVRKVFFSLINKFLILFFYKKCLKTNNFFFSTKYVVQQMLHEELTSERGEAVLASVCDEQIL